MNRRAFLIAIGLAGAAGAWPFAAAAGGHVAVKVWFSERAAAYSSLRERVVGFLGAALEESPRPIDVEISKQSVPLQREGGRHLMTTDWPRMVLEGTVGSGMIEPVNGANLLVTDGDARAVSAGYATGSVGVVTGARHLAKMSPAARTPEVVEYSAPAAVTQLLLHECGHALGLRHRHGTVRVEGEAMIASPMVGGYAWASPDVRGRHLGQQRSVCGVRYPEGEEGRERWLSLRYSDCASAAIGRRWRPLD